ncbi:NACHT domain-containing protein [Acrocarpospora corrugata]|uniref:NACHT domain-containing protein n=1 Tax=Acrocarpospora corrugata TaxID=35763 RepID=A0A5M3VN79_9ACTN|nr:NACHT domain-containing protein [Acrocarpospora corrugata]
MWLRVGATLVIAVVLVGVLTPPWSPGTIDWIQIVGLIVAVATLLGQVVFDWRGRQPGSMSTPDQIAGAEQALREFVRAQWREEIQIRELDDPAPLPVRWRMTGLPGVMDRAEKIDRPRFPLNWLGIGRPRFDGRADRMPEMAERFRQLTRRRLVIIGAPGMGKTTLAVLLLKELLDDPRPGDPVPVLLSMSGWDPRGESVHQWLARRLRENYPALRAADFGPDAALGLVRQLRVLPVLDGLDELPDEVRPQVLAALNAVDALILTCRTPEFRAAVEGRGGGPLAGGAVIEPRPVKSADVVAYIEGRLPAGQRTVWAGVLAAVRREPDGPIAEALSTPLALWLLRKVYIDTRTDPGGLCDREYFPTSTSITEHLLDNLVHAAFATVLPEDEQAVVRGGHPFRPRRGWDPDDAKRWLSFLARHMTQDNRDFRWWELHRALSRNWVTLVGGITVGLTVGLTVAVFSGLMTLLLYPKSMPGPLLFCLVGGVVGGLVGGLTGGLALLNRSALEPAYADLRLRGPVRQFAGNLTFGLAVVFLVGMVAALGFWLVAGAGQLSDGLWFGLAVVFTGGLIVGLNRWVTTPLTSAGPQTPAVTLRRDLELVYGRSLIGGLTLGLTFGLTAALLPGLSGAGPGVVAGVLFGLGGGLVFTFTFGLKGASSSYLVALIVLSLRRRVPRRLMGLLEDAHRVGLLRQAGPVYQFRHAQLQDRLAQSAQ